MTKKLSDQVKKDNQTKRKQQKPASKTVTTITLVPPRGTPPNLCDDCAYEFGECEGKPKFASDQDKTLTGAAADAVVACEGYLAIDKMPAADQVKKNATAEEELAEGRRECDVEHFRDFPDCFEECDKKECDGKPAAAEEEPKEEPVPEVKVIRTDLPQRPDPKRFQANEDFGTCQSCERPLKRTALNRYHDAVRCTNPRCRAYRAIVKTITTGVK